MITFNYNTKVYYKDIDQMGVVYYNRYFEYFEQARTELLADIGLVVSEIERKGFYLPVVSAKCNYKKGAHFEDEIIVKTTINESPLARLKIEYEVRRKKNNDLLANGYTIHGFINKKGQPKRPPKFLLDIISPFFISD